jgi:hypothetical protein
MAGVRMSTYFKPLRRKIGLVALFTACFFMAGWMRSACVTDEFSFGSGRFQTELLLSENGFLAWLRIHETQSRSYPTFLDWRTFSSPGTFASSIVDDALDGPDKIWRWGGFSLLRVQTESLRATVGIIPYWAVVIPMTLLSAWLLLSKIQPPKTIPPASE